MAAPTSWAKLLNILANGGPSTHGALAAWPLYRPKAVGRLSGDPIGAGASERLKVVVSGPAAFRSNDLDSCR